MSLSSLQLSLLGHSDEKSKYMWETSHSILPFWPGTIQSGLNYNPSSHLAWNIDSLAFAVQYRVIRLLFSTTSSLWPWLYATISCHLLRKGREQKSLDPRVFLKGHRNRHPHTLNGKGIWRSLKNFNSYLFNRMAYSFKANTLSAKTIILSFLRSWNLIRNWQALNLLGFMVYNRMRFFVLIATYSR